MAHRFFKRILQPRLMLRVAVLLASGCGLAPAQPSAATGSTRTSFDAGWRFQFYAPGADPSDGGHERPSFDDAAWRLLNLPHDWAVEGDFDIDRPGRTGKLPYAGVGWYRKQFSVPAADAGKRLFIDIDGAMSGAQVWLNGAAIGRWPYGYASFRLELTPHIRFGQTNVLAVRLDNPDNSSRWYPGGGIYRHTWLVKTNPVHVAHWGTFVTTPAITDAAATVRIQTELQNQSDTDTAVTVQQEIVLAERPETIIVNAESQPFTVAAGKTEPLTQIVAVENPTLWDIENPMLYVVRTTVKADGETVDVYETPFGIRTAVFDAQKGFLLNGERLYLKGVCLHHDLGPLGAAVHRRAIERQLEILKEMGCNSIRTSHNPPAPELLALCDAMGFVVINEAFDCWKKGKTDNDYGTLFSAWHEKDVVALVRRDRNHPSVIAWSSGNEIKEQGSPGGHALSRQLTALFHREDPTRPVTAGCNVPQAASNGFADTIDVFGFNYKPHLYKGFARRYPEKPYYSSESSSCVSSRGAYFFPVSDQKDGGFFNYQVSSYDLYAPGWAMAPDREFLGQDENPSCAGEYVWTGFDYLGEPTPYNRDATIALNYHSPADREAVEQQMRQLGGKSPSRSSYFGILDLCGFKKDRFYLYQSRWRPDWPMAHILPHWNWPERIGQVTPVHVYTSGDEAELFLNGRSLGRKTKHAPGDTAPSNPTMNVYRLRWDTVVYEPGTLTVVAYKHGRKWAEQVMHTTGDPARLALTPDRPAIQADGRDLSYVTLTVTDENGATVPRSHPMLSFALDGPGEIIATGNGDATNLTAFSSKQRKAYNGLCLVIVRSLAGQPGTIHLIATADGLAPARTTLISQ